MEDLISRQSVLDLVVANHTELNGLNVVMYSPLYKDIKQLPPVTPKPKTGYWIKNSPFTKPYCSECGASCFGLHGFDCTISLYCPNCGTKMESEDK